MTQSRYYALLEKWRNMHGYEIRDLYAVLSYIQYLDKCRPCQCAEPQTPPNETEKKKPMDYEELLEVIDEQEAI